MNKSKVVQEFYDAFVNRNGEAMAACYHPDASFSDPVFPRLESVGAQNMWRMLCQNGKGLQVTYKIRATENNLSFVDWEARYTFSKTGRKVHNKVSATLETHEGKIVKHVDDFDFWRWSRQALGLPGWFLGWSTLLKNKVQKAAATSLSQFVQSAVNEKQRQN